MKPLKIELADDVYNNLLKLAKLQKKDLGSTEKFTSYNRVVSQIISLQYSIITNVSLERIINQLDSLMGSSAAQKNDSSIKKTGSWAESKKEIMEMTAPDNLEQANTLYQAIEQGLTAIRIEFEKPVVCASQSSSSFQI
ncbi:MAG: hypothetical protein ACOVQX_04765 [Legionella sp.]